MEDKRATTFSQHLPYAVNILCGRNQVSPSHWHLSGNYSTHNRRTKFSGTREDCTARHPRLECGRNDCGARGRRTTATHGSYEGAATRTAAGQQNSPPHWLVGEWRHTKQPMAARRVFLEKTTRGATVKKLARPPYRAFFSLGVCSTGRLTLIKYRYGIKYAKWM